MSNKHSRAAMAARSSSISAVKVLQGRDFSERLKEMGWHLQFFLDLEKLPEAEAQLAGLKINIVIDHFAKCQAANGVNAPAFQALLRLVKRDNVHAKLMGAYFLSKHPPQPSQI